jgi:hypothetical protein
MRTFALLFSISCAEVPPPAEDAEAEVCVRPPQALQRLSNAAYTRSIVDLLAVEDAGASLPPDTQALGYDHLVSVQDVSPVRVEAWADAAATVAEVVVLRDVFEQVLPGPTTAPGEPYTLANRTDALWLVDEPGGRWSVDIEVPEAGTYRVAVEAVWAYGWQEGELPSAPLVRFSEPGGFEYDASVEGTFDDVRWVTVEMPLPAGPRALELEVGLSGSVALGQVRLQGPVGGWADPVGRAVPCDLLGDPTCAPSVVDDLVRRAWRRAPTDAERDRLHALLALAEAEGDDPRVGLQLAMRAVLLSPKFLYLVESDAGFAAGDRRELSAHERATRLAHLLWRSLPDEELLACAEVGGLADAGDACDLQAQAQRMLDDPRADALVDDWAAQWLSLRALDGVTRDPASYPDFTPELAASMAEETRRLLASLRRNGTLLDVLDAPYTFVDPALAAHYGLGAVDDWTRVEVPETRRGVLRQAAVLTSTSQPNRTSPVKRAQWLLTKLMCDPEDEPPDDIPALDEEAAALDPRGQLEAHSANAACASCHDRLDPLGLALEHYDATGAWRDAIDGVPVDPAGVLPDGTELSGADDLVAVLRSDPAVQRCMVQQFLTWALAEGLPSDSCAIDLVTTQADDLSIDGLTLGFVGSSWFGSRMVPEGGGDAD